MKVVSESGTSESSMNNYIALSEKYGNPYQIKFDDHHIVQMSWNAKSPKGKRGGFIGSITFEFIGFTTFDIESISVDLHLDLNPKEWTGTYRHRNDGWYKLTSKWYKY